jgi:tight adherence protein C
MAMMVLVLSFLAVFGLAVSAGFLVFYRDTLLERLQTILEPRNGSLLTRLAGKLQRRRTTVEKLVKPFQNVLPRSANEVSVLQKRLIRAGYRDPAAVNVFYGAKVLTPVGLSILFTITGAYHLSPYFVYGIAVALGFLAPDFWLGKRISKRQKKIRLGLPEALDLMVICTEAGLGIDQTILRVAEELKLSQPEIRDELALVNLEQKAGRPRDEALKNLADRIDIDTVRALSTTLIQADRFGTGFAKTLRVYSETLRTQRRQQAEEQAAKTTVKMVFPLCSLSFPRSFW